MTSMFFIQGAKIVNDNILYPCFSIFYLCNCDTDAVLTILNKKIIDKRCYKSKLCSNTEYIKKKMTG